MCLRLLASVGSLLGLHNCGTQAGHNIIKRLLVGLLGVQLLKKIRVDFSRVVQTPFQFAESTT